MIFYNKNLSSIRTCKINLDHLHIYLFFLKERFSVMKSTHVYLTFWFFILYHEMNLTIEKNFYKPNINPNPTLYFKKLSSLCRDTNSNTWVYEFKTRRWQKKSIQNLNISELNFLKCEIELGLLVLDFNTGDLC